MQQIDTKRDIFWLRLIGAGKVLKGLCLAAIAVGILRLVHTGFGDYMAWLAEIMHYSTESHVVGWLLDKASLLTDQRLEQVSIVASVYAATEFVEAYGLLRRRLWGEYMVFGFTCALLPLDVYELSKHFTWIKLAFTIANAAIGLYLGLLLARKAQAGPRQPIVSP